MKKIYKSYAEQIKYFLNSNTYIICLIIVAMLSYGFTITHYSIGVDDLCQDKYVLGTYILESNRWGTWLLYNLFKITTFQPFWLDLLVVLFMIITAILVCAFIRKELKKETKITPYIIFTGIFLSHPIMAYFFTYQSTNLAVAVSNMLMIFAGILFYENVFNNKNKIKTNILCMILLTLSVSMYQSSIQSFLVFITMSAFIRVVSQKEKSKNILKYFGMTIIVIIVSLVAYLAIANTIIYFLKINNADSGNFSSSVILWTDKRFDDFSLTEKISFSIKSIKRSIMSYNINSPILYLNIAFILIIFVREFILGFKNSNESRFALIFCILVSAFSLPIVQGIVLSRAQFVWSLFIGLLWMYMYYIICDKKVLNYIFVILSTWVILYQSQVISYSFYVEYKRYEFEKTIAKDIGTAIVKEFDYKNKPVAYVGTVAEGNSRGLIFKWGQNAFENYDYEITKFINMNGFDLKYITTNETKEADSIFESLHEEEKKNTIIETEKYIIVNLKKYNIDG